MKLSNTLLGAIALVNADDHGKCQRQLFKNNEFSVHQYGTCIKDERFDRVLPFYFGEANSVEECLAGCRKLPHPTHLRPGFEYAGLEYKNECYCGDEPNGGFDSLYTWPEECNMRCGGENAFWQNCGGAGAMNLWTVPPNPETDLGGLCVYDHPRDGRVFNGPAETKNPDMTVQHCQEYCSNKGNGFKNNFVNHNFLFLNH